MFTTKRFDIKGKIIFTQLVNVLLLIFSTQIQAENEIEKSSLHLAGEYLTVKVRMVDCSSLKKYPDVTRQQKLQGTVKIKLQVLENGSVSNAHIIKSSGSNILDNSVLTASKNCKFIPAQKNGVPIKSSVIIPVRFKLDN